MAGDPNWGKVVLAMRLDDVYSADLKGHIVSKAGGISNSAANMKFDKATTLFDGVDDYLSLLETDFVFGTGDFYIRFFAYVDGSVNTRYFIDFRPAFTNGEYPTLLTSATNSVMFMHSATARIAGSVVVANGWHYIELSRVAGNTRLFIDGVQDGATYADTTNYGCGVARPRIGSGGYNTPESLFKGNICDLVISNGVGGHTENYTVPTTPFSEAPVLSGTVRDSSGTLASRIVRAYQRSDGALVGQTVSSAADGTFAIPVQNTTPHYALALDGTLAPFDPYWSSVVLAMHMDDVGLSDTTGRHTVSIGGTAARSSAQTKFPGGYSALFNTSGSNQANRLVVSGNLTDFKLCGDFTIEGFLYPLAFGATWGSYIFDTQNTSATAGSGARLNYGYSGESNKFNFYDGYTSILSNSAPSLNEWTHFAVVRKDGVMRMYINGVLQTATATSINPLPCSQFLMGSAGNSASTTGINGYLDDFRITKEVARYTENFAPPTSAFLHGAAVATPSANALIFDNIIPV